MLKKHFPHASPVSIQVEDNRIVNWGKYQLQKHYNITICYIIV